jgi:hypothetical protein
MLPASPASHNITQFAFLNEPSNHQLAAYFAVSGTLDITPVKMLTFVVLSKILNCAFERLESLAQSQSTSRLSTSYNHVCMLNESMFVPLRADADLPSQSAEVAEFSATTTAIIVLAFEIFVGCDWELT